MHSTTPIGACSMRSRLALINKYFDLLSKNRDKLVEIARHEAGAAIGAASRAHVDGALVVDA